MTLLSISSFVIFLSIAAFLISAAVVIGRVALHLESQRSLYRAQQAQKARDRG